ncbi:MAG: diaminopimelate epimerase [bacterium]|nr:diaminopimelate epimerase [bacterium]
MLKGGQEELNYNNFLIKNAKAYQGCGNRFLILRLNDSVLEGNPIFIRNLARYGKEKKVDSVLLLKGDPRKYKFQKYHCAMEVFEPNSSSFSTMCGNGIRAVCKYWLDEGFIIEKKPFLIKTKSGIRKVQVLKKSNFKAEMGEFSMDKNDLKKYINLKLIKNINLEKVIFPKKITDKISFNNKISKIIIGLTGNKVNGLIDGEPHLVVFLKDETKIEIEDLEKYATELGNILTRNKNFFPLEINVSIVSKNSNNCFSICTYERGVYYVTKSCGTASAVAGAFILLKEKGKRLTMQTLGGKLKVEIFNGKNIYLTGNAQSI